MLALSLSFGGAENKVVIGEVVMVVVVWGGKWLGGVGWGGRGFSV